jgi:hypothetical protein
MEPVEDYMDKEEMEILEKFRQMTPENKLNFLSNARLVLATQENTRKAMKSPSAPAKGKKSA